MKLAGVSWELQLTMAEEPGDREDAKLVLGLRPRVEPDGPGPHCGYCGRTRPPSGLEDMSEGGPPVFTCKDSPACIAEYDRREPRLIDRQFPGWRRDYARVKRAEAERRIGQELAAQRKYLEAASRTAWGFYHPEQLAQQQAQVEAEDRQFQAALAAVERASRPSDSALADFAVALARMRSPDELELAAPAPDEGQGIFAEPDTSGPAPFQMQPAGWEHTMRNPANRAHTLGHMRGRDSRVSDAAAALGRRAVA